MLVDLWKLTVKGLGLHPEQHKSSWHFENIPICTWICRMFQNQWPQNVNSFNTKLENGALNNHNTHHTYLQVEMNLQMWTVGPYLVLNMATWTWRTGEQRTVLQLSTPAMKTTLWLDGRDGHVRMTDSGAATSQSVSVSKIGTHTTPAIALKRSAICPHKLYLCLSCGSHNKQLIGWAL